MTAHSIHFSQPKHTVEEILRLVWQALEPLDVTNGESYTLFKWTDDRKDLKVVAKRKRISGTPKILEEKAIYNQACFSFWIDTMEFLLTIDTLCEPPALSFTFMGDALKNPGSQVIIQMMVNVLTTLELDCAVLLRAGEEEHEMARQILAGEQVLQVVQKSILGQNGLGPINLAIIRDKFVSPSIKERAIECGIKMNEILGGYMVFSSIDES